MIVHGSSEKLLVARLDIQEFDMLNIYLNCFLYSTGSVGWELLPRIPSWQRELDVLSV